MTRRYVIYVRKDGRRYVTREFNGDKEEFERIGSMDSCTKTWFEICEEIWKQVRTFEEFVKANVAAQACYQSCLGNTGVQVCHNLPRPSKTAQLTDGLPLDMQMADEILVIDEAGSTILEDGNLNILMHLRDDSSDSLNHWARISYTTGEILAEYKPAA